MFPKITQAWRHAAPIHRSTAVVVLAVGILALVAAGLMPDDWAEAIENRESRGKNPRVEDFAKTWSWIAAGCGTSGLPS